MTNDEFKKLTEELKVGRITLATGESGYYDGQVITIQRGTISLQQAAALVKHVQAYAKS